MLNASLPLPYPVLRADAVDFEKSTFVVDLSITQENNGFKLLADFKVNNVGVTNLIESGVAKYAVQIQCISTWYRDILTTSDSHFEYIVPAALVHEKVELCPCIIAVENINDYQDIVDDFTEEFYGIPFHINTGEPIAIGERQKFDAFYQKDIIKKASSIVSVKEDSSVAVMECFFDNNLIEVRLPKRQHESYKDNGSDKNKYSIMNSIVVIPAIIQALDYIYHQEFDGDGNYDNNAWYKTLKFQLLKLTSNDRDKMKKMLEQPVTTAQLLIDDVSGRALEKLKSMEKKPLR